MGDTKKSMMTEEERRNGMMAWQEKKIQKRLEVIKDDYIVLAGFVTSGNKSAEQRHDILEEMKRLVNERAVLLKIIRKIYKTRRTSLHPNSERKTNGNKNKNDR